MILRIEEWIFDIDMERTMSYSASEAAEHCDCAYCRNFYEGIDCYAPGLREFLVKFGVNIEAPDVLYPYDIYDDMFYDGEYVIFGNILQAGNDGITCGSVRIYPQEKTTHLHQGDHFAIFIEGLQMPWILDEPLSDVVSTANEPSFLKKMWDRLLNRGKDTNLQ